MVRIVILGGGFAGTAVARRLEQIFGADAAVEITLVDRENFSLFTPLLPEVSSGAIEAKHIVSPLRAILGRTVIRQAEVRAVDRSKRIVLAAHCPNCQIYLLPCDHLVVVWSYPRGSGLSKAGETALDVTAYAAPIAAQLGAHVVKVKLASAHLEQAAAKTVYEQEGVLLGTLAERVRHVVQAAFDGRRIVIFSGGAAEKDEAVFEQVRAIRDGGGFGSIIGRNSFQRKKPDALRFLKTVMDLYSGATKS